MKRSMRESKKAEIRFWKEMMAQFGNEEEYNKQLINRFKNGPEPEIIIVVDKLLTGFDAPRNTVLYLCKTLKEHSLLQAIARVNRLHEGKEFGYIVDYANILGELDQALNLYNEFEGYDEKDIEGTLTSVRSEIDKLPQRYSNLCDLFKPIKNKKDEEEYELFLGDESIREEFYHRLKDYSNTLAIALSSDIFYNETSNDKNFILPPGIEKNMKPLDPRSDFAMLKKSIMPITNPRSKNCWILTFWLMRLFN